MISDYEYLYVVIKLIQDIGGYWGEFHKNKEPISKVKFVLEEKLSTGFIK